MRDNDPKAETTEFKGRRILVTGGTRGIGEAIVDRLIRGGGDVIATARSVSPETSADRFVQADVSTRDGIDFVAKAVTDRFKGLDILIHNVGGSAARGGGALALSDDDWQHAFDTNLFAAVRLDRAFLPSMLKHGSGVIIHISSIQRTLPLFDATLAYAATKAALTNSQQRPFKRGESEGDSRELSCAWLHRDKRCCGNGQRDRGANGHQPGCCKATHYGFTRRHPARPAESP